MTRSPPSEEQHYREAHRRWSALAETNRDGLAVLSSALPEPQSPARTLVQYAHPHSRASHSASALSSGELAHIRNIRNRSPHPSVHRTRSEPPSSPPRPSIPISDIGSPSTSASASASSRRWDHTEIAALKQKFNELDASGKGKLSRSTFYRLFQSIVDTPEGVDASEESPLFDFAYNLFDCSDDDGLDLKEFISGCWILSRGSEEERLRYLFHMYDKDDNGSLTITELQQVFRVMQSYAMAREGVEFREGIESPNSLSRTQGHKRIMSSALEQLAAQALSEHDSNNDGKISFDDFQTWCTRDPIVKTWMDTLSQDTARGIARLREQRERTLLAKELNEIGLGFNQKFWNETLTLESARTSTLTPEIIPLSALSPSNNFMRSDLLTSEFRLGPTMNSAATATPEAVTDAEPDLTTTSSATSSMSARQQSSAASIGSFEIDFNKLTFERRIGEGSFAEVYSGSWLDSPVAIKVFKSGPRLIMNADGTTQVVPPQIGGATLDGESFDPTLASTIGESHCDDDHFESTPSGDEQAQGLSRFLQEVALLTSLRHPNVLLYMGACVKPHYPLCIVSELIDGGSLHTLLHGRGAPKLTLAQKMKLTQDIARGMFYLHSCSPIVLHRDLKSANILVERTNNDQLKATIIDFGLSRLSEAESSLLPGVTNGICGSLVTMAPEIMGRETYVPKSDVYSFAIIVWEIFTGRIPFKGLAPGQLVLMVSTQNKRPPFRSSDQVPQGIRTLIEQCWRHDVDERLDFLMIVRTLNQVKKKLDL